MASASRALRLARLSAPLRDGAYSRTGTTLRPLAAASGSLLPAAPRPSAAGAGARHFATQAATRDSSPGWNNRPPNETILLDGCDFEHWLVVMDPPPGEPGNPDVPRDEIIGDYIRTLAQVVGSEEEARQKIYSVSTRYYFAFGALVSEELSYKIKELPRVRWVLPDSYLDVKNKNYGGEPFINGQAVPYDPKYHEEWVRNNDRARNRPRNDRPRNFDRSRNFERRDTTQNFQNRDVPPGQGFNTPPPRQNPMPPRDTPPMHHSQGNMSPHPPPHADAPPAYQPHAPSYQQSGVPGFQGGPTGYQGSPAGNMHDRPGPPYQSNNTGYNQRGGAGYQGGGLPPFQGSNPPPHQGGGQPPFQSVGPPPPYQGGSPSYGGSNFPGHHPGQASNLSYQQSGSNYNTGSPAFEERDGSGRNYQ